MDHQLRSLETYFSKHPENLEKMVFLVGPRQTGKTTLLQHLGPRLGFQEVAYLNWDRRPDQRIIRDPHYAFFKELIANSKNQAIVLFDELHKFPRWKSFLKGFFDTFKGQLAVMVTGSARLNVYRRGSDSLLGRYWLFHLYPFSLAELARSDLSQPFEKFSRIPSVREQNIMERLWKFGGFPDPYLHATSAYHLRWIRMRRERLIQEDLRDLSRIHDLAYVEQLMQLVIASVGSTLSLNSLHTTMDVSYNAVKTWLGWLEAIYYVFRINTYSKKIHRSVKKEGKYYLYDWSEVKDEAARFENMIAVHLKKTVDFWNDTGAGEFELNFARDHQKREVDFVILKEKKPWMLVECKLHRQDIEKSFSYLAGELKAEHNVLVYLGNEPGKFRVVQDTKYWVTGAAEFLLHFA